MNVRVLGVVFFVCQINFAQNNYKLGSFEINNDAVYNTTVNSGNVAKIDMGFDGRTGYVKFGAHTGNGYRDNVIYMRGIDGYVGLATNSPRAALDVATNIQNGGLGTVFGRLPEGNDTGDGTFLGVRGYSTSVIDGKSFSLEHSFYGIVNSSISFYRGDSTTGGGITFSTNNNKEQMRIDRSGNVGIGTLSPDSKLTVKGNIHAQEVKVTVNAGNVPDYVFANDYKLRSLQEVEKYIKENNHLPEIPSAQEIEKNGLMLAEMNMNLLKKIEEMTLYMIEQEKKNNKQSLQLELLEKENLVFKTVLERLSKIEEKLK